MLRLFLLNKQRGFTIVEIIVAMALLAILTAATVPLFTGSFRSIMWSGEKSEVTYGAQKEIEEEIMNEERIDGDTGEFVFKFETSDPTNNFDMPIFGVEKILSDGQGKEINTLLAFFIDNSIKDPDPDPEPPDPDPPGPNIPDALQNMFDHEMALFAAIGIDLEDDSAIELKGSVCIEGAVGTNASQAGDVQLGPATKIKGDLYVGPDADANNITNRRDKVEGDIINLEEVSSFPEIIFPEYPNDLVYKGDFTTPWVDGEYYLIDEDGSYDLIHAFASRIITVDLDGGDRKIRVKNLNISQGFIELINVGENGRLIFYVEDAFTLGGSSKINESGNIENVIMYYKGDNEPSFGGNTRFVGSLFAETADLTISGSNGVTGHIVTGGNVEISGNADMYSRLLYAPNGTVSVEGSGKVKGTVVANALSASGGSCPAILFEKPDMNSFPFEFKSE